MSRSVYAPTSTTRRAHFSFISVTTYPFSTKPSRCSGKSRSVTGSSPRFAGGACDERSPSLSWCRRRDFSELTEDEIQEVRELIADLVWRLGERLTRRQRAGEGRRLDLRRTLRQSFHHGGEILSFARRRPRRKPRPLVVIADISGSMERYTRLLLHFSYSLTQGLGQRVEAFAFGTRLTRLSRHMRDRDVERALSGVSSAVTDWSGGTRIGDCLHRFNYDWARRVLSGGAIVLLISDGWDRGDPEILAKEMDRLRRSCHRLVWLNPLLGSPEYEPLTRGMQAALPHVDNFLPVHNLKSLEDLAQHLENVDRR